MSRWLASVVLFCVGAPLFAQSTPAPGENVGFPLPPPDVIPLVIPASKELDQLAKPPAWSVAPAKQTPLTRQERKKLEGTAYLPHLSGSVSIKLSMPGSPSWGQEPINVPEQIANFEKQLKGDDADAESLLELGFLDDDREKSKRTFERAAELFRNRIKAEPKNGWLHAQLAEVVSELELWREAEEAAGQSVRFAPDDWRCWNRCADLQYSLALFELYDGKIPRKWHNFVELIERPLAERKFTDAQLERIEKRVVDCGKFLDRMVEAAPKEPHVYEARCYYRMILPVWQAALQGARGRPVPDDKTADYLKGFRADLRTLARFTPDSPDVLMLDALFVLQREDNEAAPADAPYNKNDLKEEIKSWGVKWRKNSVESKKIVLEDLARLEELACRNTHGKANVAAKDAGILQAFVGNYDEAEKYAWLLLLTEPKTDDAWDFLEGILLAKESDHAAEISAARVQANPTPRNHYLHAETLFAARKFAEAEKELRAGLKQDDRHLYCRLGLAALLLYDSARDGNLAEAATHLQAAAEILRAAQEPSSELRTDLTFLQSLHYALSGDFMRSAYEFARVLTRDPDHRSAHAALRVLCTPAND